MMKTTNCLKPCFSSRKGTVRLFVAITFCTASIFALGCKTTSCCQNNSDDPGKLATVDVSNSDSVSRGQTTDASAPNVPSAESAERHDRIFSDAQKSDSQTTTVAESSGASTTIATNDASKNSEIIKEDINSLNFFPTTTKPSTESPVPNITPAPMAPPQSPAIPNEVQNSNQNPETSGQVSSSNGFVSVAPSPGQESQGSSGEHMANSSQGEDATSGTIVPESNQSVAPEPPVEMDKNDVPSTFANEENAASDSIKQSTSDSEASGSSVPSQTEPTKINESATQPIESDASRSTEKQSIVNPTLDPRAPVTLKPTAFSRVVEVQTTSASNFLESRSDLVQPSAKRGASGGVSLLTSESSVRKPIDASKDVAHLKRIRSR